MSFKVFSFVTCPTKQTPAHTDSTQKERIETTNTVREADSRLAGRKTQRPIERELVREVMGVQY